MQEKVAQKSHNARCSCKLQLSQTLKRCTTFESNLCIIPDNETVMITVRKINSPESNAIPRVASKKLITA